MPSFFFVIKRVPAAPPASEALQMHSNIFIITPIILNFQDNIYTNYATQVYIVCQYTKYLRHGIL